MSSDKDKPIDSLPKLPKLNPESEGAVLTGDGNIAHTQWRASSRHVDPGEYATSIMPTDEAAIVRTAVQRGVVQAVSQTSIEDLLKQSASERASVAANARDVAQAILNRARSGIVIEQLILKDKIRSTSARALPRSRPPRPTPAPSRTRPDQSASRSSTRSPAPPLRPSSELIRQVQNLQDEERPARGRESARHHLQAPRRRGGGS